MTRRISKAKKELSKIVHRAIIHTKVVLTNEESIHPPSNIDAKKQGRK